MQSRQILYGAIIAIINICIILQSINLYTKDFANKADNRTFYQTANQIDNKSTYNYMLKTEAGSSIIQTKISGVNPVALPEVTTNNKYIYLHAQYQEYLSHIETYTETTTDSNGDTHTEVKTRIVWEWEDVDSKSASVNELNIFDHKYSINLFSVNKYSIDIPLSDLFKDSKDDSNYQSTGNGSRTIWTGIPDNITTTFYGDLSTNGLQPIKFPNQKRDKIIRLHANQPIKKFMENELKANTPKPIMWVLLTILILIIITLGLIVLFIKIEE